MVGEPWLAGLCSETSAWLHAQPRTCIIPAAQAPCSMPSFFPGAETDAKPELLPTLLLPADPMEEARDRKTSQVEGERS